MNELLKHLLDSSSGWGGLAARLTVGLIMLPHGMQKVFGLFGGDGFSQTVKRFTGEMGFPLIIALLIIFFEFIGSVSLILGFASRFMAFGILVLMLGAIITVHWQYGYFLNWHNTQQGEGMQFNLLMMGICFVVMIIGSGKYSIDSLFFR